MSEVKRFTWVGVHGMIDHQKGGWVKHEDYAALKAEFESNAKSAQYSAETNRKISRKNGEMHDEIISLKAEHNALATENLALKSAIEKYAKVKQDFDDFDGDRRGIAACLCEAEDALVDGIKTPATDAYANKLRAEGVEIFAKYISLYNSNAESHADEFVANLRKENSHG